RAEAMGINNGLDKIRDACVLAEKSTATTKGKISEKKNILADRVKYALDFYDFSRIKPLKIVADAANAMGALDLEALFEKLSGELVKMNFKLDGTFPVHEADPFKDENITDLKKKVVAEKADLGIATDGDADRFFFIDDKGELVRPEIIRGLMAQEALRHNPGAKIGYDVRPGMITKEMIEEAGGKPFVTKVGHSLIKKQSIEEEAVFSGESSGHFFFRTDYGFYETPFIVTLILMKMISESGKSLAEIVAPFKKYHHSGEINSEVEDKESKMKELEKKFGPGAKKISWLDGISIEHDDWWFNVRASNTEPKLRLNLEANTESLMKRKVKEVLAIIRG
ncbi:phosphomannomutase/phosphoglucomutase, partial [Patescibacteria group bacterium]